MKLMTDWRRVLRKAWSVRLMALAALLSGAEAASPVLGEFLGVGPFALMTALLTVGALVARLVAQKGFDHAA